MSFCHIINFVVKLANFDVFSIKYSSHVVSDMGGFFSEFVGCQLACLTHSG